MPNIGPSIQLTRIHFSFKVPGQLGRIMQLGLLWLSALVAASALADISFVPGDYYTTNRFTGTFGDGPVRTITQHDQTTWQPVGQLTIPPELADEARGLTFGPDSLLYVIVVKDLISSVLAIDSSGVIQQTYPVLGYGLWSDVSFGKVAFDRQYLYIAGPFLVRYRLGDPSSGIILPPPSNGANDVKPLPNGNLLVAETFEINEITVDGALVRNIPLITTNPLHFLYDITSIEFDPVTNNIFIANFLSSVLRMDPSGVLEKDAVFSYPADILVDLSGDLVVSSNGEAPRFFTHDLDRMGTLGEEEQHFVTRYIPWPSISGLPQNALVGEATGPEGGPVSFSLGSNDLEGNANILQVQPSSGSTFPVGTTPVTATAIDRQTHITTAAFDVLVRDTTPPAITAPGSLRIKSAKPKKGQAPNVRVNFADQLFASDLVDGTVTTTATPASGSLFPFGTTTVTVTAQDSHGNKSQTSFPVVLTKSVPKPKKPTVNVSVSPASIAENGNATVTVNATSTNPSRPTVVNYQISGTATPANQFFTLSRGQIVIPAGKSSGSIILHSIPNPLSTGSETATITLTPAGGYTLGKTKSATLTINNR